jgi:hypothetical protein
MSETNPYAPPQAVVDDVPPNRGSITAFTRFTTWGVVGLAVITLSIYVPYWLYTRTKVLDRVAPEKPIPPLLINAAIMLFILSMLFSFLEGAYPTAGVKLSSSLLGLLSGVSFIVWAFMFRSRLNTLLGASSGDPLWLGPIMTFFFQILYLNYKINQGIDAEAAGRNPAAG